MGIMGNRRAPHNLPSPNKGRPRRDFVPETARTMGERIKVARFNSGLTQVDLAEMLGVSASLINLWESDAKPGPRIEQVQTMARLFSLPMAELVGDPDPVYGFTEAELRAWIGARRVERARAIANGDMRLAAAIADDLAWANERLNAGEYDQPDGE